MAEISKEKMQAFAIIVTGLAVVVLIGLAIIGQYSEILRLNTADVDVISLSGAQGVGNRTRVGAVAEFPFLQTLTTCFNSTNATRTLPAANFTISEGDADGGFLLLSQDAGMNSINCSLTYLADTNNQAAADSFTTGITIFATFMAVIVLALVGKIIIGLFTGKKV